MRRARARLAVSSLCRRDILERGLKSKVPLVERDWCAENGCSSPFAIVVVVPPGGACGSDGLFRSRSSSSRGDECGWFSAGAPGSCKIGLLEGRKGSSRVCPLGSNNAAVMMQRSYGPLYVF
jgi:hypothetical protein